MDEASDSAARRSTGSEPVGEPGSSLNCFDVHLYCLVRVKVCGVTANCPKDAIDIAEEHARPDHLFARLDALLSPQMEAEYADEILGYLVDEAGDEQYERTGYYCRHKRPLFMSEAQCRCERRGNAQTGLRPLRETLDRLGFRAPGSRPTQRFRPSKRTAPVKRRLQTSRPQPE